MARAAQPADDAEDEHPAHGPDYVQSLERGLSVIRAFNADNPELTLSDVARLTGLSRAVVRRSLLTLQSLGYVRTDGRLFALRARVLELGYAYLSSLSLPDVALPQMEALVAEVSESCSVSILEGNQIVYLANVPTGRIMTVSISVGSRFPAHATSMGQVLLSSLSEDALAEYLRTAESGPLTPGTVTDAKTLVARLEEIRSSGFAIVEHELQRGIRAIAVPVRNASGEVIAALNLSAPTGTQTAESMKQDLLGPLLKAAAAIEADIRGGRRGHL